MKQTIILLIASILLMTSCSAPTLISTVEPGMSGIPVLSATPRPVQTLLPEHTPAISLPLWLTFTPSLTSTPQPPLTEHEWYPETVLVSYERGNGDGCCIFPKPPKFILYSDGQLFVANYIKPSGKNSDYREQILLKQLNREKTCQVLNTFDQIGYLDYDSRSYQPPAVDGDGIGRIIVNAWKIKQDDYYGLTALFYIERMDIPRSLANSPALRNAYYLLTQYPTTDFRVYKPEELVLWIYSIPNFHNNDKGKEWSLPSPSLADLHTITGSKVNCPDNDYVILNGQAAQNVFDFFGQSFSEQGELVFENGSAYIIYARPLLPYEAPKLMDSEIPTSNSQNLNLKLICHPNDGVLPIPTPSNP